MSYAETVRGRSNRLTAADEEVQHAGAEDADIVSANYSVRFKSISGAREQNQKPLVRIMRELLSKMESEEKEFKGTMEREQSAMIVIGRLTN